MGLTNFPNGIGAAGSVLVIKKTLISSNILVASDIDVTNVSTDGELILADIILKTGTTGLAGGTNFEINTDNVNGILNILTETVANLGANQTISLRNASVAGEQSVLELGKKITAGCSGVDCTGAGTIDIYLVFSRVDFKGTVTAA